MSKSEENRDARQSHHLCHNLARLIDRIESEHAAAIKAKDAGVYRAFNDTYSETQQHLAALEEIREKLGEEDGRRADGMMNRVKNTMDRVSPSNDEVIEGPKAVENYPRRLRREPPGGRASSHESNSPLPISPRSVPGSSEDAQRTEGQPVPKQHATPPDPLGEDGGGNNKALATPPPVKSRQSMVDAGEPPPIRRGKMNPDLPPFVPQSIGQPALGGHSVPPVTGEVPTVVVSSTPAQPTHLQKKTNPSVTERVKSDRKYHCCLNCLQPFHGAKDRTRPKCCKCQGPHHELLHSIDLTPTS